MARQIDRLSAARVKNEKRKGRHHDGGGLYLQVNENGAKSWIFTFMLNGRARQMGLGDAVKTVSLAEARLKAIDCRKLVAAKIDPIEARNKNQAAALLAAAQGMTFEQCAKAYIEAHEPSWRNKKHKDQWKNTLATYVYPLLGELPVQDIEVGLIRKVLDPIWKEKTETATRLRARIEKILDWAKASGCRQGENPARWRGHLENLLAHRSKIQKVQHHRALPYKEVGDFVIGLQKHTGTDARVLEFTILTACRTNEVTNAKWEEIDLGDKLWVIPDVRMKMGREHRVPLSEKALVLLTRIIDRKKVEEKLRKNADLEPKGWIFPGRNEAKPISNMAMLALLKRMRRRDITVHGFRSTFRDWVAESTAYPREVAEAALAHAVDNKTEAAYQRGDFLDKRRELMTKWGEYCYTPSVKDGKNNVVPMRQKKSSRG